MSRGWARIGADEEKSFRSEVACCAQIGARGEDPGVQIVQQPRGERIGHVMHDNAADALQADKGQHPAGDFAQDHPFGLRPLCGAAAVPGDAAIAAIEGGGIKGSCQLLERVATVKDQISGHGANAEGASARGRSAPAGGRIGDR